MSAKKSAVAVADTAVVGDSGVPAVTDTAAAVDWDALPTMVVVEYTRQQSRVDVEASTPAPIRSRVDAAYAASKAKGEPAFRLQPSLTDAEGFVKLMRRYATFKGLSLRGGKVLVQSEIDKNVGLGNLPEGTPVGSVVSFAVTDPAKRGPRKAKAGL